MVNLRCFCALFCHTRLHFIRSYLYYCSSTSSRNKSAVKQNLIWPIDLKPITWTTRIFTDYHFLIVLLIFRGALNSVLPKNCSCFGETSRAGELQQNKVSIRTPNSSILLFIKLNFYVFYGSPFFMFRLAIFLFFYYFTVDVFMISVTT